MLDRARFYNSVRPHVNLTTQNVAGFEKVLDYAEAHAVETNKLAYILATAYWETAQTMWPVREAFWLSEDWRKKNLRYWPYYGRGLIQTTWRANYQKMGDEIGVDLVNHPDRLLEWDYALPSLFVGMEKGLYTGKALVSYIDSLDESDNEDLREYIGARRIVNGTDKAGTIAQIALRFEHALRLAGYEEQAIGGPNPKLYRGINGSDVIRLQELLNARGAQPPLFVDGKFGPGTEHAVTTFQKNLIQYGVVGPLTWAALEPEKES